jgi:hypothetical protein
MSPLLFCIATSVWAIVLSVLLAPVPKPHVRPRWKDWAVIIQVAATWITLAVILKGG